MTTEEIRKLFTTAVMLDMLPAEIIFQKKHWYTMNEIFDLAIRKSKCFNTWTVEYFNDRSLKCYFQTQSTSLDQALAEMIEQLIKENFIQL